MWQMFISSFKFALPNIKTFPQCFYCTANMGNRVGASESNNKTTEEKSLKQVFMLIHFYHVHSK